MQLGSWRRRWQLWATVCCSSRSELPQAGADPYCTLPATGFLDGSADTCVGDSGGPLVDPQNSSQPEDHRQVGIVSWGVGCAEPGFPGVYTRLDSFAGFIEQQGYCGCTSTGLSGSTATGAAGCSARVLEEEQQVGLPVLAWSTNSSGSAGPTGPVQAACYVLDPKRCSYAATSERFPGAALAPCSSRTNATFPAGQLAGKPALLPPLAEAASSRGEETGG